MIKCNNQELMEGQKLNPYSIKVSKQMRDQFYATQNFKRLEKIIENKKQVPKIKLKRPVSASNK